MAISLHEAGAMVEAADRNKVKLLAGHTRAFTLPIRAMHRIITSGHYGSLQAVNIWAYSDWMLRPRTADELDPNRKPDCTAAERRTCHLSPLDQLRDAAFPVAIVALSASASVAIAQELRNSEQVSAGGDLSLGGRTIRLVVVT